MYLMNAAAISVVLSLAGWSNAIELDINSVNSVSDAAKTIVSHIMSIYEGNDSTGIPGLFPMPYYWWESGLTWDMLIQYWALTSDDTYNDQISQGLLFQIGPETNFMPPNQSTSLGNDDQATWALACMTAAEYGFPDPPADNGVDSWLQLAKNVFDSQASRWDKKTCDGGLRWQIYPFNLGYDYKNSQSNGDFMQLAARLAHYTGNSTYTDWAQKMSDWSFDIGLIEDKTYNVFDGARTTDNCKDISQIQWTATLGIYMNGYSYLANASSNSSHQNDERSLVANALKNFVTDDNVLVEFACQPKETCNVDQITFRGILARAFANAKSFDDSISSDITPVLQASAKAAAAQCSGGKDGNVCGGDWTSSTWDGTHGLSEDLSALGVMLANLPPKKADDGRI